MRDLYERFVRDRPYTKAVSEKAINWYWQSWDAFQDVFTESPDALKRSDLIDGVGHPRERGGGVISVNTYARAINAFLKWLKQEGHLGTELRIPRMKEPDAPKTALRPEQVQKILAYRPPSESARRSMASFALLILDSGLRINEVLSLRQEDPNFYDLLMTVRLGKGGKSRVVPFTAELRRRLCGFVSKRADATRLVFGCRTGTKPLQSNIGRDWRALQTRLGIEPVGFHALRHTFAVNYIRAGADLFRLQRMIGHSTLDMIRRYVNLQPPTFKPSVSGYHAHAESVIVPRG